MTDFTRNISGFRFAQTEYGDTMQVVAARELGDASQWSTLVWLNGLVPPYLTDDASQAGSGVLLTGAIIRIPAASAEVDAGVFPDEVFKADCQLHNGSLQFAAGDLALVSGRANLHQAMANLITTDRGELVFHGNYGANLHPLIGALNGPVRELVAADYVTDALAREARIQAVTNVEVSTNGDRLSVAVEVVPISGANINLLKVV